MPEALVQPAPQSSFHLAFQEIPKRLLPLQGLTILVVEDSRYASDAMRLLCQRAGARLRRADCLAAAEAHLLVYRPDVVIVDLGLPDGRGEGLISTLVNSAHPPLAVLGTSGHATGQEDALQAGADGFLAKPISNLTGFCSTILAHLPKRDAAPPVPLDAPIPDSMALHDDLARAARLLALGPNAPDRRYIGGFLLGLARMSNDSALAQLATRVALESTSDTELLHMIESRLAEAESEFSDIKLR